MRCPMCGNDNPSQYSFCLSCGTRLNDESTLVAVTRTLPAESERRQNTESPVQTKKGYLKWPGIAVVVIAFLGLFVIAEYFYQKSAALERQAMQSPSTPSQMSQTEKPSQELQPTDQTATIVPTPDKALTKVLPSPFSSPTPESRPIQEPTSLEDYNRTFALKDVTQKARILSRPEPQYTEEARKNQISGTVVLRAVLGSDGTVTGIRAVSGLPFGLTERAIAAAQQIKFVPAQKDGRAVSQYIQIEYNFNVY